MKKEELKSLLDEFKANIKKIDELNSSNKKIVEKFDLSSEKNVKDEEKKRSKKMLIYLIILYSVFFTSFCISAYLDFKQMN